VKGVSETKPQNSPFRLGIASIASLTSTLVVLLSEMPCQLPPNAMIGASKASVVPPVSPVAALICGVPFTSLPFETGPLLCHPRTWRRKRSRKSRLRRPAKTRTT